MDTKKEAPKPPAVEQKPAAPKNEELSDEKLEKVAGGIGGGHLPPSGPGG